MELRIPASGMQNGLKGYEKIKRVQDIPPWGPAMDHNWVIDDPYARISFLGL